MSYDFVAVLRTISRCSMAVASFCSCFRCCVVMKLSFIHFFWSGPPNVVEACCGQSATVKIIND